jgi:hypothetical protein
MGPTSRAKRRSRADVPNETMPRTLPRNLVVCLVSREKSLGRPASARQFSRGRPQLPPTLKLTLHPEAGPITPGGGRSAHLGKLSAAFVVAPSEGSPSACVNVSIPRRNNTL